MNYWGFQRGISPPLCLYAPLTQTLVRVVITTAYSYVNPLWVHWNTIDSKTCFAIPGHRDTPSPAKPSEAGLSWRNIAKHIYLCETY